MSNVLVPSQISEEDYLRLKMEIDNDFDFDLFIDSPDVNELGHRVYLIPFSPRYKTFREDFVSLYGITYTALVVYSVYEHTVFSLHNDWTLPNSRVGDLIKGIEFTSHNHPNAPWREGTYNYV